MSLLGTLRRAWKRHDDHLAQGAYRNEAAEARLEALDERLETAEMGQKVYGPPDGGPAAGDEPQ